MKMQQCFFIFEEVKETILDFSQGAVKVFLIHFALIYHQYKNDTMQHCKVSISQLKGATKLFYALFECGHYFVQCGLVEACIFYLSF